ncbi:hypothetical protein SAMN05446037_101128 [Anaerovirgula multivorans]|uniref:Uncharacterized protein n=1 Tax=Anaerovirgula multivorans TaxID=312168 RepID=A0A239ETB4_9FIRM|nr:hypothetical protein [Anaerovirgula multivorans]SNS48000.1 hypothetical protein SAMN05446037_101128 [Anaerovirgula multivorans]
MDTMPIKAVILNAMPEAVLLIYLGLILIGIRPDKKRVFIAGVIQGMMCYYIRKNYDFGIHIFMQYLSFVLMTCLIVKIPILAAVISNFVTFILAVLLESFIGLMIPYIIGMSMGEMMSREWLRVIWFSPYLFVIAGITYLADKYKFTLEQEIKILQKINGKIKG